MLTQKNPWKTQILNCNLFLISSKSAGSHCPRRDSPLNKNWNLMSLINVQRVMELLFIHELIQQLSCWSAHDNLVSPRYYNTYKNNSGQILELKFKKRFFKMLFSSACHVSLVTASKFFWTSRLISQCQDLYFCCW